MERETYGVVPISGLYTVSRTTINLRLTIFTPRTLHSQGVSDGDIILE
jgi:hypothetical protein